MCPGNPDRNFVEMLVTKKGKIMSRNGNDVVAFIDSRAPVHLNGDTYTRTVRRSTCEIITNNKKCRQCVDYRDTLRKSFHRWKKGKESPNRRRCTASTSRTNLRYVNTPEKRQCYRKLKIRSDTAERKVKKMMERLTEKDGVELETDVHADMQAIMNEMTGAVRKENSEGSFRRIFWDEQLKALQTKDPRQVRWHPALIKWCLHLKFKSTSAYYALRSTGVLTLPSEQTLFDYSHWMRGEIGFQAKMNDQLLKEVDQAEEKNNYVVLAFDEMKIREDLVFDKHSCSLLSFVNLGDVTNALDEFEGRCKGENESNNKVATHMLTFMVRGIFSDLNFPYAHFPSEGASADQIFPLAWEAVRNLEESGLKVMVMVCDGASSNRKFFWIHCTQSRKGEVTYKTKNLYSQDGRDIYFMSDVPHLIKTTRNCWSNSFGHNHTRALWVTKF